MKLDKWTIVALLGVGYLVFRGKGIGTPVAQLERDTEKLASSSMPYDDMQSVKTGQYV